ncbi:hypothetical protein SAMN05428979_0778 [Stappia sp. ES.058]|nr:hypothetical protein SAMN05428979_0778 [Stappia sp. ES.058]
MHAPPLPLEGEMSAQPTEGGDASQERDATWLPLSRVAVAPRETAALVMGFAPVTVTVPQWLAAERGLI